MVAPSWVLDIKDLVHYTDISRELLQRSSHLVCPICSGQDMKS
ncbi:rCG54579 [Rattus norvegicus]|uniref:RCG54579 n=1 Tax=Rattus norvegicus TaxID=10116 RepID=A6JBH0_RAT|nr:rCG54579 [Rattus norvegicus]